jgi:thiamine pyrophosphate-dependent acetolactate synthase large subunit-like protein
MTLYRGDDGGITQDTDKRSDVNSGTRGEQGTSRRGFLGRAAAVTAAVGSMLPLADKAEAKAPAGGESTDANLSDGTAKAFQDSLAEPPTRNEFSSPGGISGAQIFANLCKDEDLAAMFLAPGNYVISHELAQVGVPAFGGRNEGAMASAADGFSRASGLVTACSGTEGPGFTNMITAIAAAHAANTPLLVLASNRMLGAEDSYKTIQFLMQQNQTLGIRKYGKRITAPERIYEYACYAFRNLKSGIPGVVHLDFPEEVADARFTDTSRLTNYFDRDTYRSESRAMPNPADVTKAVKMIGRAERPVLVAGHGVHVRKGYAALLRAAEKNDIGVIGTGPVRGNFPDEHRLALSMANDAMINADLVVIVGQYVMPTMGEWTFPPGVTTIRIHPESEDIGRNWPIDLGVVCDEGLFLEALADALPRRRRDGWVAEIATAQRNWLDVRLGYYRQGLEHCHSTGRLHPAVLAKEVHDFLYKGAIDPKQTVTGYGGHTIGGYVGQWLRAYRPGQEIVTHYQFGTMGPEIAMMIGSAAAVTHGAGVQNAYKGAPTFAICGDGGVTMSLMEIETAVKYRIPLVAIISNNNCWGTFPVARATPRAVHIHLLQENLRYDKIAEAIGARGEYVHTPDEFRAALQRSYDAAAKEGACSVINCQSARLFSVGSAYPPGQLFNPEPGVGALFH